VVRAARYGFSLMLAIIGSPETVARKIAANLRTLDATRFDLKFGMPGLSQETLPTNIALYGTQVIPRVRELRGDRQPAASARQPSLAR
jgi:alkanesulfonate monooxygenase SsuD/methylene tetrahydromethanopterin reductase-like flavin-dependent oxidoreductase (luciferase family)